MRSEGFLYHPSRLRMARSWEKPRHSAVPARPSRKRSAPAAPLWPAPKAAEGHERKSHVAGDDRRETLPICALDGSSLLALMIGLVNGFDGIFPQML